MFGIRKTTKVFFFFILLSSLVLLVTCVIMQKNGAGMQTASTCFWDNSTDGKDKNTCVFLMQNLFFFKLLVYQ